MKTQAVSNQNFNGNIFFIEKKGQKSAESLGEHIVKKVGKRRMEQINEYIKDKPFDVFISRSEIHPEFYIIDVDETLVQALRNRPQKGYTEKVSEGSIVWLPSGIKNAVENYENFVARIKAEKDKILKEHIFTPYKIN